MNPTVKRKLNLINSAAEAWGREIDKRSDMFFEERKWLLNEELEPKIEPLPEQLWKESDLREQHLRRRLIEAIDGLLETPVEVPKPEQQVLLEDIPPDDEIHT